MNDTRSTHRRGRVKARFAAVLCLMVVACLVPATAYAAVATPRTWTDASVSYLDSATIHLFSTGGATATYFTLDGGAPTALTTVNTSVYGAHTLKFWSVDALGNSETTATAPFFVDEDVLPTVVCDAASSYRLSASIDMTATDNFNGSGVSYLYYRVDNGPLQQVIAPAKAAATTLMVARLRAAALSTAGTAKDLTTYDQTPPHSAYGTCSNCHDLVSNNGGGTGVAGGVAKSITVTGIGTHTLEYWAQDIARNATAHVTKTFAINKIPTSLTIKRSASTVTRNGYVTVSGTLKGGAPLGAKVVLQVKKPGSTKYVTLSTRSASLLGAWSYKYKLTTRGKYYFRSVYAGDASYLGSTSAVVYTTCK